MARPSAIVVVCTLVCISLIPGVNVAKRNGRDEILKISDFKDFKKHLRTHNNVLVVLAKTEKSISDWKLLGDVALEIRGIASIVFVNCGDHKKLCKKLKASPASVIFKHYHEGEFNKDYDRKHSVKSMVNFLRDPKGDLPWEEDIDAQDVVHLENKQALSKLLTKDKRPTLVMFYAPWCGFCKRLKPDYALAASDLKGAAVMAGMDVDRPENMAVRTEYNITGFPTMLYFESGKMKYKYGGENNREGLVKWMKDPQAPQEAEKEEEWSDQESDVVHLTTAGFDDFMANNPSVLVMFYAPWCGHCKKLKPDYEEAAAQLKDEEIEGIIAAVDATKEKELGERFSVKGYPTVKYFKDGEETWDYSERTKEKIVDFMKDPQEPPPPPAPEPAWEETPSDVSHLTDETFKSFLKKKKHTIVMFYAPWCGHCKKAKPEYMQAAEQFQEDTKVAFAAVDCTVHTATCGEHDVTGYPSFKYFNYGKNSQKYTGGREEADFVNFMKDPQNPLSSLPPPPPSPATHWGDAPGNENLHHLTDASFDSFIKSHSSVLVMFYAPWCGHCKTMKPAYAEAALLLQEAGVNGVLATVDSTVERAVSSKYEVKGYPTIKYFKDGLVHSEYSKGRKTGELVAFMKNPEGDQPTTEQKWSDEPSKIQHLNKNTFSDFIGANEHVLVMFYAPWCPHCQRAKPEMKGAAEALKEPNKHLAAVDCTDTGDLCLKNEINEYPTFKYYHKGQSQGEYNGERTKDALLKFMEKPSVKPATPEPETKTEKEEL